ncbi:MAG TPA: hypothetical protein VEW11_02990 [Gaiellaceae bacterium]|nr:hypothetical protein [Gaiellaceae bacterium]
MRKGRGSWSPDERRCEGELDGPAWELELEVIAPPFRTPRPLLRPVASSQPDGRWAHVLAAEVPGLPPLSQHGSDRGGPGLPLARSSSDGTAWRVGPWSVDAAPSSFLHVPSTDVDGSTVHCYHSPAATLTGPGLDTAGVSYEIAARERLPELEP